MKRMVMKLSARLLGLFFFIITNTGFAQTNLTVVASHRLANFPCRTTNIRSQDVARLPQALLPT